MSLTDPTSTQEMIQNYHKTLTCTEIRWPFFSCTKHIGECEIVPSLNIWFRSDTKDFTHVPGKYEKFSYTHNEAFCEELDKFQAGPKMVWENGERDYFGIYGSFGLETL